MEGDENGRGHTGESLIRRSPDQKKSPEADIRTERYHDQLHRGTDCVQNNVVGLEEIRSGWDKTFE